MKIMAKDSSASARQQSPHVNQRIPITDSSRTPESNERDSENEQYSYDEHVSNRTKIEALAEIICAGGDQSAAALLVLMGALETSTDPQTLAHTVKHLAFTRCGELNVYDIVDAQIALIESELLCGKM